MVKYLRILLIGGNNMAELITTEFSTLKEMLNASKTMSGTVVAYRFGEIRVTKDIAYIPIIIGRNTWYLLYTRDIEMLTDDAEVIEVTINNDIKKTTYTQLGENPRSIYFIVIRPLKDDLAEMLLKKINKEKD